MSFLDILLPSVGLFNAIQNVRHVVFFFTVCEQEIATNVDYGILDWIFGWIPTRPANG